MRTQEIVLENYESKLCSHRFPREIIFSRISISLCDRKCLSLVRNDFPFDRVSCQRKTFLVREMFFFTESNLLTDFLSCVCRKSGKLKSPAWCTVYLSTTMLLSSVLKQLSFPFLVQREGPHIVGSDR